MLREFAILVHVFTCMHCLLANTPVSCKNENYHNTVFQLLRRNFLLTAWPWAECGSRFTRVFFSLVFVWRGPNFHSAKLRITQPGMNTTRTMLWILKWIVWLFHRSELRDLKENEINFVELVANESRMLCLSCCWKELSVSTCFFNGKHKLVSSLPCDT